MAARWQAISGLPGRQIGWAGCAGRRAELPDYVSSPCFNVIIALLEFCRVRSLSPKICDKLWKKHRKRYMIFQLSGQTGPFLAQQKISAILLKYPPFECVCHVFMSKYIIGLPVKCQFWL